MKKYKNYVIGLSVLLIFMSVLCFIPISASKLIPIVEKQVSENIGADAHLEHLIIQIGPKLKAKSPIVHLMYEDGQKFAQLDAVKFYIPWSSVLTNKPVVKCLQAKNLTVRVNSDDKFLPALIDKLGNKDFSDIPSVKLKGYKISYFSKKYNDKYTVTGQELELTKIINFKNFKVSTKGFLEINDKQHINYDISIIPNFYLEKNKLNYDCEEFLNKIKHLEFHSDIIADLKLYKNQEENIQASGFLNIDNISVIDKTGKNPKSFIYITLWGDKASILSNIYTSANSKVYIEGMVNNSKKPVLDLKVKADKIDLSLLFEKVKIFADFSKLRYIDSLTGMLNANFSVKGDINKLKSNGYLKISDAEIISNGLKFTKINSDIDFSNNMINITNAVGYVNNSPIMLKGNINKDINLELLMSKVELKYLLPVGAGVKNGIISLAANITGKFDNIIHKENLQIDNLLVENKSGCYSINSIKIDTNKNNTAYINGVGIKTQVTETIKIPSLRLFIDKDLITLPETNVFMPNSKLIVKGNITNYNNKDMSFNANLDGNIYASDLKFNQLPSGRYPLKFSTSGNKLIQNINSQILFEKADILDEPAILNIAVKTINDKNSEKINLKVDDLSLSGFNGKFSHDLKSNLKNSKKLLISGIVEDIKGIPNFKNIRINAPQVLDVRIYDTIAQLKCDLFINGLYNKPEIVGQIFLHNLFNQQAQLSLSNCTIDFNKNQATINAPMLKVADSSMGVNAILSNDFGKNILVKSVNVKAKFINTDTLLMYKDTPIMKLYPIQIKDGKFYSEKVLMDLYGSQFYLTALSSDFNMYNNKLLMKNLSSEIFNGKLAGNMDFNLKDESFNSKLMARSVSAASIFDIISARNDNISGTMDFDTSLNGNLSRKNSLNGDIKFIIHNGRMSTLGKLEHLLYAQNVVADNMLRTSLSIVTKAITLKDTGLFKYLRGDIIVNDGIADIKMIQSVGPLMSLYMKGQYNPENDYAKLIVLGRLSDEIMSGLGAFGDFSINKLMIMLTGEDSKYNILPADIENLPQLPVKNTKEFRSVINGIVDKPSSVQTFNWISYSEKSFRQKDVPMTNVKVPSFVDELPY